MKFTLFTAILLLQPLVSHAADTCPNVCRRIEQCRLKHYDDCMDICTSIGLRDRGNDHQSKWSCQKLAPFVRQDPRQVQRSYASRSSQYQPVRPASGTNSRRSGSGQWWCTAQGSSVRIDPYGNREVSPISMQAVGDDHEATGLKALKNCNDIMRIQTATGDQYSDAQCEVTNCHPI